MARGYSILSNAAFAVVQKSITQKLRAVKIHGFTVFVTIKSFMQSDNTTS